MNEPNNLTKDRLAKFMKELYAREAHLTDLEERRVRKERDLEAEVKRIRGETLRVVEKVEARSAKLELTIQKKRKEFEDLIAKNNANADTRPQRESDDCDFRSPAT